MEPRGAGFEGELGVPSWLEAAAWPEPEPSAVKMPMLLLETGILTAFDDSPWNWTATWRWREPRTAQWR